VQSEFLMLRNPIVRSPTVSEMARGYPTVRERPRILLIGDPNRDDNFGMSLAGAAVEVEEIARITDNARYRLPIAHRICGHV